MSDNINRKKERTLRAKKKYNRMKLLKLAVILIIVGVFGVSIKNIVLLQAENKELKDKQESLVTEKEVLKNELKNVNDKDYIEEQARIQLRMIKPGEIIYILQEEQKKNETEKKN